MQQHVKVQETPESVPRYRIPAGDLRKKPRSLDTASIAVLVACSVEIRPRDLVVSGCLKQKELFHRSTLIIDHRLTPETP